MTARTGAKDLYFDFDFNTLLLRTRNVIDYFKKRGSGVLYSGLFLELLNGVVALTVVWIIVLLTVDGN